MIVLKILGKKEFSILPNGGAFNGDESHGIQIRKN